jgi:predicted AAA+ superfamily ATPase
MNSIFQRYHKQILTKRIENEPRRFIQVLYGPRQVGKTTLVTQFLEQTQLPFNFISADAIPVNSANWISQNWEVARLKLKSSEGSEAIFIIDEIQKIDNWSEHVKKEWDADTRGNISIKVIILGSSRLLLQKGLTESLAGRFETTYIGHWSFEEMHKAFGFTADQYVWFGGYPGAAELIDDESRWKRYISDSLIETSISKDILMLTRVDKPALMKRLFELGCQYSGYILSFTKIMGQLQDAGNTTTLAHYLHLLDTAGLLGALEKYTTQKVRQRSSSPKFQVHNTALITAQQPLNFNDVLQKPSDWGRWVESSIGAHLLNNSLSEEYQLFYWRHRNNEVDFIIESKGKVIGLEIKSGKSQKISGIDAFKNQHKPDKIFLIGDSGIPWQDFLKMNPKELF